MPGRGLSARVTRTGTVARLLDVSCTYGRRDRPFPEEHAAFTVALVRRGEFTYRSGVNNRACTLRPGWLLVGRPGSAYECSHEHDGGDECVSLAVSPEVADEVARKTPGCSRHAFAEPAVAPVPRVAALLELARKRSDADVDEVAYLVAEALALRAASAKPVASTPAPHRARVLDAARAIEDECTEPLTLAELAARADLSPFYFLRLFRDVTGTTPHQYLIGARVRLAAKLLLDTTRPITSIAYDVGFGDLSNFIRTFHKSVGCSPRAFRGGDAYKSLPWRRRPVTSERPPDSGR